ncbi:MAG: hypothetical protein MJZ34_08010 [Paludibacteraceae bacterium]|nr:hypothetical protein [Paludibacteraceae bacterium]
MTDQEWKDFMTCPKEVSDRIIAYYGLHNPGTYIYYGERLYDKETKKHHYVITWTSLSYILKDWDEEIKKLFEENSSEFEIYATKLLKKRVKEGFYE